MMDDSSSKTFLPLLAFAFLTVLLALAMAFVYQSTRRMLLSEYAERDLRRLRAFEEMVRNRVDSLRERMRGAELLVAPSPREKKRIGRALSSILGKKSQEGFAASVLLNERGAILASRRAGNMPSPSTEEKRFWVRARNDLLRAARRRKARPPGGTLDVQAVALGGVPAAYLLASSPATGGFWGVLVPAESLLSAAEGEVASGESVFLLAAPAQKILFARRGDTFFSGQIAHAFEERLAAILGISRCCVPSAFNAVNEDGRWMTQAAFQVGVRELRLVHVAGRENMGADLFDALTVPVVALGAGGLVAFALFFFMGRGRRPEPEIPRLDRSAGGEASALPEEEPPHPPDEEPPHPLEAAQPPERDVPVVRRAEPGQLAVISRMSELVASGEDFRRVITASAREVARFVSTDRYCAALYDEATDQFHAVCASRIGEAYRRATTMPALELPERIALREREIVEVMSTDAWHDAPEVLKTENVRGAIVFPLCALGKVVGMASFYFDAPREMSSQDVDYCAILLKQGAVAISRALSLAGAKAGPAPSLASETPPARFRRDHMGE